MHYNIAAAEFEISRLQECCKTYRARISELERSETRLVEHRDRAEEMADQMADAISGYFGLSVGEHSNANDPWVNALLIVENAGEKG